MPPSCLQQGCRNDDYYKLLLGPRLPLALPHAPKNSIHNALFSKRLQEIAWIGLSTCLRDFGRVPVSAVFASGEWGLRPVHRNRVGLVLDAGIEEELKTRHLQARGGGGGGGGRHTSDMRRTRPAAARGHERTRAPRGGQSIPW